MLIYYMKKRCKIVIKKLQIIVDLNRSITASEIWKKLPINSRCNTWGKEIYFYTSLNLDIEFGAKSIIDLGEIAYWPVGNAIVIGYGKTPISIGEEIRLASDCNIWGSTNFDLEKLGEINDGDFVSVKRV